MKRLWTVPLLLGLAGCLSSGALETKAWLVAPRVGLVRAALPPEGATAFAATRLGPITVCAPYDRPPFVVQRGDGSVAFDAYNVFAAAPASLLRAAVEIRLEADGRFGHVVAVSSSAAVDAQVEVTVTDLSLDCREDGRRVARAALTLDVVKMGRGPRDVALTGSGAGTADAQSGDYTTAFSSAIDTALAEALKALK